MKRLLAVLLICIFSLSLISCGRPTVNSGDLLKKAAELKTKAAELDEKGERNTARELKWLADDLADVAARLKQHE